MNTGSFSLQYVFEEYIFLTLWAEQIDYFYVDIKYNLSNRSPLCRLTFGLEVKL